MSKRLILILAFVFVVSMSFAAYAEVQNVKVSGDITVQGVARNNFDLSKTESSAATVTGNFKDKDDDISSIAKVRVDADLTDNVSASVRILNERVWNGESNLAGQANRNIGINGATTVGEINTDVDLAYVNIREFLYSPLSLSIGRQNLRFGNGFVVGDPDTNIYSAATSLSQGDLSARKSFDAARATLDYNPLVMDIIYAKIEEGVANINDDITLSGMNASYALNRNTTLEGFFFTKVKGDNAAAVYNVDTNSATTFAADTTQPLKDRSDIVNTIGARVVDKSLKNLTLDGQIAFQFGRYNPKFDPNARYDASFISDARKAKTMPRNAWATQLIATYDLKDVDMISKYSPAITGTYTYLSGANRDESRPGQSYTGWNPMFEDQTIGHIMNGIFAETNMHRTSLSAKAKLTDDITANLDYVSAWFAKKYPELGEGDPNRKAILSGIAGTTAATSGRAFILRGGSYIGQEIDATLTYDYTEDVQLSLLGGVFLVGNNIVNAENKTGQRAAATELIGSMKVTF